MKRPTLSADTFLAAVFHPSKNPRPVGLRKATVKSTAGGKKSSRVRSFNRMDATKQEILKRTGNRDKYLRGEITLPEARRQLRGQAVERGIAKPLIPRSIGVRDAIDNILRLAEQRTVTAGKSDIKPATVERNVKDRMTARQINAARNFHDYDELKRYATNDAEYRFDPDTGEVYNPFWYK